MFDKFVWYGFTLTMGALGGWFAHANLIQHLELPAPVNNMTTTSVQSTTSVNQINSPKVETTYTIPKMTIMKKEPDCSDCTPIKKLPFGDYNKLTATELNRRSNINQ